MAEAYQNRDSVDAVMSSGTNNLSAVARKRSIVNVIWNWAGVVVEAVSGLLITPLLIHELGDENYSLWILIGSMTGFFGMLDLGMRGAVGRFVAFHHAKNDSVAVQRVLSTAAVALCGVAFISLCLTAGAAWALPRVYSIPVEEVATVQWATIIVGVQLALFFVLRMFDAALWAHQRFDLLNLIDIPTCMGRAGLIALLITRGGGLVTLAWISLGAVLCNGLAKCWLTYRVSPGLQIRARFSARSMLRELVTYGFWNFIISIAGMARTNFSPLLLGKLVGLSAVGPFSIVMRLPTMAMTILSAATGVFTPVAVAIHAHEDNNKRHRLLVEGTRLSLSLALYFLALFVWLGKPLLSIWIKPEFADYWQLLVIVACGELLPMSMSVATGMILAMARHRALAQLAIAETVTGCLLATLFGSTMGLVGFVTSLAITTTIFRGVFVLGFICRVISSDPVAFVRRTFLGPLVWAALACLPLHLLVMSHSPTNWGRLFAYSSIFSAIYALAMLIGVMGIDRANKVLGIAIYRRQSCSEMHEGAKAVD